MNQAITLEAIIGFLLETPMFEDLDSNELSRIVQILQLQKVKPGQWVFREGEPGEAWYVLFEGEVEVVKGGARGERRIAELPPRSCFGEIAILDHAPRSASVRASKQSTVLVFPRMAFANLLKQQDLAAYKLVHQMALVLARRQRETMGRLSGLLRDRPLSEGDGIKGLVRASPISE